jgi:phosphoribosylformimino-5-aminoimidazole carboxamide ribotide isomerase
MKRSLLVIPAVDVLGEEAVRLEQGNYERISTRAGAPIELVARLAAHRPPLLHLVDLDGARSGRVRPDVVARVVTAADGVRIQASGGIRSVADAQALLDAGAVRVVVGTAAWAALDQFVGALGDRLVVAIDVRDGGVAVAGWTRATELTAEAAAERCAEAGVPRILCTAVERDGTLGGPDLELLARVRDRVQVPVLAAGGVRTEADLDALEELGVEGAIVGRALLDGSLPLETVAR